MGCWRTTGQAVAAVVGRAAVKVVGKVEGSWAIMMAATMAVEVGPFHTGSTWHHDNGRRNPGGSMWS